jgi:plastocyanin
MSISQSRSLLVCGLITSAFTATASAQQFQYQAGLIPGTPRWTEGVEAADVDNDGDFDLFFAEGDGFASAGTQRQNVLVINQFVGSGTLSYTNESVARLGVHVSNAKGVATGDIDGDGYIDAVFANGFNTDPPFMYINQGAGNPGFYNEQAAARGITEIMSSAGAGLGDLDDDGDLDLILNDVGGSFLGGAGDRPNLYMNDGAGNFTERMDAGWAPPIKKAQMDVQFIDIDNDMDLDFVGYCRGGNTGGNHYLMINDGNANFTDSSSLLPNGSTSCYEAELGDLDGDFDSDVFMVSLNGFAEGPVRNNLVESGTNTLTFTAGAPESVSQDDNEVALCDYDNDGDLDPFIGSLATKERIYRNDGGMNFSGDHGSIQTVGDSTLDCTFADVDNDGDYDFITSQGESNPGQYVNKIYINNGPADTIAPTVMDSADVGALASDMGPWVAKSRIQDAVVDDGKNWVTGAAHYVVVNGPATSNVNITGGGFSPNALSIAAGNSVTFTNTSGGNQTVTSTTAPYTYDSGTLTNGQSYELSLVRPGVYQIQSTTSGQTCTVTVTGAAQSVDSTYSGGGIYRAAMTGNGTAANAVLVYEWEFTDYAGNIRVTDAASAGKATTPGAAYCFGDGTGGACPCGANGGAGEGCANTSGSGGASLTASGVPSFSNDSLSFSVAGVPGSKPGLLLKGDNQVNGGLGNPVGDGLICTAGGSKRSHVQVTNASGATTFSDWSGAGIGTISNAGVPTNYQFWYRDNSNPCSGSGFNFSNAWSLTYMP